MRRLPVHLHTTRIAIVGAGLSGLYAAYLLEQQGVTDYVLFEARQTLGGRILSACAARAVAHEPAAFGPSKPNAWPGALDSDRVDLGPTWYWPDYQHPMARVVHDLGLTSFQQFDAGDTLIERSPHEPPTRMRGTVTSPPSMRLVGGLAALTDALHGRLNASRIRPQHVVRGLQCTERHVELDIEEVGGGLRRTTAWRAEHVLLALPPRLVENTIEFHPPLPAALAQQWRASATWMAPHAKYLAVYDTPFWRAQGLSGSARSAVGPLGEIHDACTDGGAAALFGFFGVPAHARQRLPEEVLRAHCRAQLTRLFGSQAAAPKEEFFKDWAQDKFTATPADLDGVSVHAEAPAARAASGPWSGRITGIASEWSPQFPGYLAGALEAAIGGVNGALSAAF